MWCTVNSIPKISFSITKKIKYYARVNRQTFQICIFQFDLLFIYIRVNAQTLFDTSKAFYINNFNFFQSDGRFIKTTICQFPLYFFNLEIEFLRKFIVEILFLCVHNRMNERSIEKHICLECLICFTLRIVNRIALYIRSTFYINNVPYICITSIHYYYQMIIMTDEGFDF